MKRTLLQLVVASALLAGCLTFVGCGAQSVASHAAPDLPAAPNTPQVDAPRVAVARVEPALPAENPKPEPAPQVNDAPKPPTKQRLPADRQPRRPGDAEKITFEDLNLGMQADVAFRPFMITDRVKELEGQRVSIIGFMHEGQLSTNAVKEFVLLKNLQCKFGPGGQADHLGMIYLKPGTTTRLTKQPLKVEGNLEIEARDVEGVTWSIYNLKDATAEVVKVAP